MYVTHISDWTTISDPCVPAPHPHAGRLGLDGTSYKEPLLGGDVIQRLQRPIPFIPFRFVSVASYF